MLHCYAICLFSNVQLSLGFHFPLYIIYGCVQCYIAVIIYDSISIRFHIYVMTVLMNQTITALEITGSFHCPCHIRNCFFHIIRMNFKCHVPAEILIKLFPGISQHIHITIACKNQLIFTIPDRCFYYSVRQIPDYSCKFICQLSGFSLQVFLLGNILDCYVKNVASYILCEKPDSVFSP